MAISGRPGSGKSVVARLLSLALDVAHLSAGDFMRDMAAERGMTILELSRVAEGDESIDREIDERSARLAGSDRSFVMDARLGWYFIPDSVKVFLDVRPEVAASRVYGAGRATEKENVDLEATVAAIARRTQSERERYIAYYGIDYLDPHHYDLVIDTSDLTPDQVVEAIVAHLRERDLVYDTGAG